MRDLYVGLLSGTSLDAIDAVLVAFTDKPQLIATHSEPFPIALKQTLSDFILPGFNEIDQLGQADVELGYCFASAVKHLLQKTDFSPFNITAIGSHGQNVRHRPNLKPAFTLQIGDPNIIAAETGIITIADFRRADLAQGGQGAPLAPLFHQAFMSSKTQHRAIVNIGGIANVTLLSKDSPTVFGFDTGIGNALSDAWIKRHKNTDYDDKGRWAANGKVSQPLLTKLLADPYFSAPPPKSTGKEYFNLHWLNRFLTSESPDDVQTTLIELTAQTIINAITPQGWETAEIIVCGGGAHNVYLLSRLAALTPHYRVLTSDQVGIAPDWLEAMLFAWLAKLRLENKAVDTRSITGAAKQVILGGIFAPPHQG